MILKVKVEEVRRKDFKGTDGMVEWYWVSTVGVLDEISREVGGDKSQIEKLEGGREYELDLRKIEDRRGKVSWRFA